MKLDKTFEAKKRTEDGKTYIDFYLTGKMYSSRELEDEDDMTAEKLELFNETVNAVLMDGVMYSMLYGVEEGKKRINSNMDTLISKLSKIVDEQRANKKYA